MKLRGRPAIYDNTEILTRAQRVFWNKGFTASSLDDVLEAMGIGSGSFYNAFKGGKKELFSKAIDQRREAFEAFYRELRQSENPIDLIWNFFHSIAFDDRATHLQGCIIVNTVVEMANLDEDLEQQAVTILKDVEQMFTWAIAKAQQDGKMQNQTEAAILGRYLITFWSGLNIIRRMYPDHEVLTQQIEMQLSVLS